MVSADSGLSKWALGTTSCIYLVQTILLSVLLSLGAQWEACNWEWEASKEYTFGPWGFCVKGDQSTIPTRCMNPATPGAYGLHEYTQKICLQQSLSLIHI